MKRLQNQLVYHVSNALRRRGIKFTESADPRVTEMHETISALDNKAINFKIEQHPDGTWTAESINIDGIMSGGTDPREVPEMLKDAIFTYFEIPPRLCNDTLLRTDNEPVKVERTVHVGA